MTVGIFCLMVVVSVGANAVRHSLETQAVPSSPALEQLIPESMARWRRIDGSFTKIVDPVLEGAVSSIYAATLNRVYRRDDGKQIMLSIAFSPRQNAASQVHRPEVCYAAQGFEVRGITKTHIALSHGGPLPTMRMVAVGPQRNEPVTYWLRIGESVVRGNVEQGLARVSYGLKGQVPDGLVFRVSSVDLDNAHAFGLHEDFVGALLESLPRGTRKTLIGQFADAMQSEN
jgi:EpsI family protein